MSISLRKLRLPASLAGGVHIPDIRRVGSAINADRSICALATLRRPAHIARTRTMRALGGMDVPAKTVKIKLRVSWRVWR